MFSVLLHQTSDNVPFDCLAALAGGKAILLKGKGLRESEIYQNLYHWVMQLSHPFFWKEKEEAADPRWKWMIFNYMFYISGGYVQSVPWYWGAKESETLIKSDPVSRCCQELFRKHIYIFVVAVV